MSHEKNLYLDLMIRCLCNTIYQDEGTYFERSQGSLTTRFSPDRRQNGADLPSMAHTMVGELRLRNLQSCVEGVLKNNVAGDFIETGVWRGGATIFMRAILKAWNVTDRLVWVADSFEGMPPPDPEKYPRDAGLNFDRFDEVAISLDQVQSNFQRYGLQDDQVRFLKGWFRDTLPTIQVDNFAVIRLDGDLYESTMDGLVNLYPKLSPGGYLIVDDFGAVEACRQAVHDYRSQHNITDVIHKIDWTGVFWKRAG